MALMPAWYMELLKSEAGALRPNCTHWKVFLSQESLANLQVVALPLYRRKQKY